MTSPQDSLEIQEKVDRFLRDLWIAAEIQFQQKDLELADLILVRCTVGRSLGPTIS